MQIQLKSGKLLDVLIFVINLLGLAASFGAALFMALASLMSTINPIPELRASRISNFLFMCGLGLVGCIFIPAVYFSLQRMIDRPVPAARLPLVKVWQIVLLTGIWLAAVLLSSELFARYQLGWLAAAPFFLATISLPVILLVWIGTSGLPLGSWNRFWSTLGLSTIGGPLLATLAEFAVYIGILLAGIIALLLNPDWLTVARQLTVQLSNVRDLEQIRQLLSPYLTKPLVILLAWTVFSVAVPLIEEAVKPLAVWFTVKRLASPAEGFVLGLLSGAGFALVEGLVAGSNADQGWGTLLVARAGGSLVHILASGMMGWGIVSAWQRRRAWIFGRMYLLSCFIHGLWNTSAVMTVFSTLRMSAPGAQKDLLDRLLSLTNLGIMAMLIVVCLIVLVLFNRKLRHPAAASELAKSNV